MTLQSRKIERRFVAVTLQHHKVLCRERRRWVTCHEPAARAPNTPHVYCKASTGAGCRARVGLELAALSSSHGTAGRTEEPSTLRNVTKAPCKAGVYIHLKTAIFCILNKDYKSDAAVTYFLSPKLVFSSIHT